MNLTKTIPSLAFAIVGSIIAINSLAESSKSLTTVAERSGFKETGRYQEVIQLCHEFQHQYPKQVRCEQFGTTPEGRPMMMLIASETGAFTPELANKQNLPVVLMQGGIHAGEIDGKDAGFLALRQILNHEVVPGSLKKEVLIFVPVFNIDGHERFGKWNRPNQIGPEQMGWRTTAQNLNLNRDYMKADAPEMKAMLALLNRWDPLIYVDYHVTDGAKFQHDVSINIDSAKVGDPGLQKVSKTLRENVQTELTTKGSMPLPFYPSFVVGDDPSSGFDDGIAPPRFSNGFFWLSNRIGILVETHSWKDYPTRVRTTYNTFLAVVGQLAEHGTEWRSVAKQADQQSIQLGGQTVALNFKTTDETRIVDFNGYEYQRLPSDVSGALMTRYDDSKPQVWHLPLRDHVVPDLSVIAPKAGYIVPAAFASWMAGKLNQHGIKFSEIKQDHVQVSLQTFRANQVNFNPKSFEGHQPVRLQGEWKNETRNVRAGSLFVPINQAKAKLLMALLEPMALDSLAAWGEFNNAFENKEYMEDYVAEDVARQQLAADPELAKTFQKRLESDPAFAKDPEQRLRFFYQRHAAFDERLNLYPVMKLDTTLE